ncbi:cysteine hydrolase [Weissella muntiaci]|uniref:Cysteine hydrolase n=1 Tax=Weissella muntiaci TaxID=2508881 RepID=A0A6C2CCP5_9LACO|nr:cysteine hydrolase [Weissella muntiaci]TYC50965.1 cysteine hydrolase [Weissella muntiaci]
MDNQRTAIVLTDPQVEFLKPTGRVFGLTEDILSKYHTIENMIDLVKAAKKQRYKIFVSPHYFYNHDSNWRFGAKGEMLMLDGGMFHRNDQYEPIVPGSGSDFIEEFKALIDDDVIITSPHKIFGPESNDLSLQLRKNGIDTVILGGMNANLCVESHLRALIEQGFHTYVVADSTGAPGQAAYDAALTNFGFLSEEVYTTKQIIEEL